MFRMLVRLGTSPVIRKMWNINSAGAGPFSQQFFVVGCFTWPWPTSSVIFPIWPTSLQLLTEPDRERCWPPRKWCQHQQNIGLNNAPDRWTCFSIQHFHHKKRNIWRQGFQLSAGMRKILSTGKLFDLPRTPLILLNCAGLDCSVQSLGFIEWPLSAGWLLPASQSSPLSTKNLPSALQGRLSYPTWLLHRCWNITEQRPGRLSLCIKEKGWAFMKQKIRTKFPEIIL